MDHPFESSVILSLCPGILGLERGLERVIGRINIAAYVEIEAFIIENLLQGMEAGVLDPAPIWTDVKTFDAQPFRGKIHGIIGGYPCQPFSTAGKQLAEQDPRHLWPYIKNHIETIQPPWCFFENVAGHLRLGFRTVKEELEQLGYAVKAGIYTAQEVGAPHERKRLYFLAVDYAHSYAMGKRSGNIAEMFGFSAVQWAEKCAAVFGRTNSELADACGTRSAIGISGPDKRKEGITEITNRGSYGSWPAGQGYFQYPFEHPRTIKPGVGCSAYGYNFRSDLLRALGNSAVEQTAELAFIDLIRKHLLALD